MILRNCKPSSRSKQKTRRNYLIRTTLCSKAKKTNESSNPIVLKALAKIDGKLTNLDKAKAIYEKAGLTNNSHYAWVLHDYGDFYKGKGDYLKAEEYYDYAIKIFEGLGDLRSLSHTLKNAGVNLKDYVKSYSEQAGNRYSNTMLSKLPKAKEFFIRQKLILNSKELLVDKNFEYDRSENSFYLGSLYLDRWVYENSKEFGSLGNYFSDYKDYELTKNYFDDVYRVSKNKGYYDLAWKSSGNLGNLNYIINPFDINLIVPKMGFSVTHDLFNFELDQEHTDKVKASKFFEEASEFASKDGMIVLSLDYLHRAAMVYPDDENPKERQRVFTSLLNKIDSLIKEDNKFILEKIYLIKMDIGITFIGKVGTEKEVLNYYKNIIEDKRFTIKFLKDNYPYLTYPQHELSLYFDAEKKYCEAAKWEKERIELDKLLSNKKSDTKNLERFTRKCSLENPLSKDNPIVQNDSVVSVYFKNRFYDLADIFTIQPTGAVFGAQASLGPIHFGLGSFFDEFWKFNTEKSLVQRTFLIGFGTDGRLHMIEDDRDGWFRKGVSRKKTYTKGGKLPLAEYGRISANAGAAYGLGFEFNFLEMGDFLTGFVGYDLLNDELTAKAMQKIRKENMLSSNELNSSLLNAVSKGNLSKVTEILEKGANPNAEFEKKYISPKKHQVSLDDSTILMLGIDATALMLAADEGHVDIVAYLIKRGANINQFDSEEKTALHYACDRNRKDIVKLLIENGADVNLGAYSPLMHAARHDLYAITKMLVENKANVKGQPVIRRKSLSAYCSKRVPMNLRRLFHVV